MVAECVQAASSLLAATVPADVAGHGHWDEIHQGVPDRPWAYSEVAGSWGRSSPSSREMLTACMSCLTLTNSRLPGRDPPGAQDIITRHEVLVRPMLLGLPNINEQVLTGPTGP